jgi:hypothetical protein
MKRWTLGTIVRRAVQVAVEPSALDHIVVDPANRQRK